VNDVLAGGLLSIGGVIVGGLFGLGQARSNRRHDTDEREKDRVAVREQAEAGTRLRAVQSAAPVLATVEKFLSGPTNPAVLQAIDIGDGVEMERAMDAVRVSMEELESPLLELVNGLPTEQQREAADDLYQDLKQLEIVAGKYLDDEVRIVLSGGRLQEGSVIADVSAASSEARRSLRLLRNALHGNPGGTSPVPD
jgi:hypothetical protein